MRISISSLKNYLTKILGDEVEVTNVRTVSGEIYTAGEIKGYGYGEPLLIEILHKGESRKLVINTIKPGEFGHEYVSDRAAIIIWNHISYNKLPNHVKSIGIGYFTPKGELREIKDFQEFFQVVEYVDGEEYYHDLERIGERGEITKLDLERIDVLANYISKIHAVKSPDPKLYRRRIRELIGHGEALMGLIDSYRGDEDFLREGELREIEIKCVYWRWKIRDKYYRLSQVHGDFHPWNIKFREGTDFTVLDRSRGEWGEPADDLAAMTINYMFFSLIYYEKFADPFKTLWNRFFETYLNNTGDYEILRVIQPFYAWRGLVIASPIWYPHLKFAIRRKIFNFIMNVLESEEFDYKNVEYYLGD